MGNEEHGSPPCKASPYRAPTFAELDSTNMKTPHQHKRSVRINCPTGIPADCTIVFEDGEQLTNVLRAVIAIESTNDQGRTFFAQIFITRFNNEIGKVVYEVADCFIGEMPVT